ncbi:MAG: response regulator transcription factor [Marinobacter sp.]|uniref:response regulator transcription factor n=1 Tax=Marinobacter sp. TaxID=50741 RepID=UPI00299EA968|nr:response regulator transcription factor [Marinobacter sp.]MDX1634575.1 response regulator transcription factor [Marinobacter sp.]
MKILIADDHSVVRQGYASLLHAKFSPCDIIEADSGEGACALYASERPDLAILDIGLPGISGIEAAQRILQGDPEARILFFSMYDESQVVKQALAAGGLGYITKSGPPKTLVEAVAKVARGEPFIEYDLVMRVGLNQAGSVDERLKSLTQKEFEVFVMLARGEGPEEIGQSLDIGSKTVSNYVASIKSKLQVSSIGRLVHLAIDAGVIQVWSDRPREDSSR